ncbi:MAG: enantiomer-selective amidase [Streptosporangiaceae bacterium]|nr:enantiomer-selective amidase [Streptosporangiaceae bacterium]
MQAQASKARTGGYFTGRTVVDLGRALRAGTVTAAGLVEGALASISELDAGLGAFVTVAPEPALAAARHADAELAAGVDRGPLHGIPVAVKDIIAVEGLPTTMGSAHYAGHVSTSDAECVRRLRAAGAVIVGKTTTHEFAYGPTGDRSASGASRNPHDPTRMSGGSSGGSAVAVAAGLVPLALGTDTGGSIRIPAALCGVAGFKPAHGVIPADGVFPLAATLEDVGVLAGTADDCRVAYRVLAGLPAGPGPAETDVQRIGWVRTGMLFETDHDIERLARGALSLGGAEVEEIELPDVAGIRAAFSAIQDSEAYAVHADRVTADAQLFDPEVLDRLRQAAQTPGWRYVRALAVRSRLQSEMSALLSRYGVLALPTTPVVAPPIGARIVEINGTATGVRQAVLSLTSPWNLLGLPALSVPVGMVGGLPAGLQLITGAGHEDLMFAVAGKVSPNWPEQT